MVNYGVEFAVLGDDKSFEQHLHTCDVILDTMVADHDYEAVLQLLAPGGTYVSLSNKNLEVDTSFLV